MIFRLNVFGLVLALTSLCVNAGLDDDFVFSSKFGLSTESVTTRWNAEENGLIYGGQLNGVPRDTWHDLYYLNGQFTMVVIGYQFEPRIFETEKAARKWTIEAVRGLVKSARRKYGDPTENTLSCEDETNFTGCGGSIVWKGSNKVFEINALEVELPSVNTALLGFSKVVQMSFSYSASEHFDLLQARLPSLIRYHNERVSRRIRRDLNRDLRHYLIRKKITLDEFLLDFKESREKINEIVRRDSVQFIGGVKTNYTPLKWAKAFRLQ